MIASSSSSSSTMKKSDMLMSPALTSRSPLTNNINRISTISTPYSAKKKITTISSGNVGRSPLSSPRVSTVNSALNTTATAILNTTTTNIMSSRIKQLNDDSVEPMKVYLRIRPLSSDETKVKESNCFHNVTQTSAIIKAGSNPSSNPLLSKDRSSESEGKFSFSHVFNVSTSQLQLFRTVSFPLLQSFVNGHNILLLAYGVTNAGKTYTISGSPRDPGVVPRSLEMLFKSIPRRLLKQNDENEYSNNSGSFDDDGEGDSVFVDAPESPSSAVEQLQVSRSYKYSVWLSYYEIYKDNVFDLLDETPPKQKQHLKLEASAGESVSIKNLTEVLVGTIDEVNEVIEQGLAARRVGGTKLNKGSSRSHAVLVVKLFAIPNGLAEVSENQIRCSKLCIVDLAGSERSKRTDTAGERFKEATNINSSLLVLGRCMEALRQNKTRSSNQQAVIPPWRESKLTRICQEYFVGNGKASMIVNVSPTVRDSEETLNVLKFSAIAKEITTQSKITLKSTAVLKKRKPADEDEKLESATVLAQQQMQQQNVQRLKRANNNMSPDLNQTQPKIDYISMERNQLLDQIQWFQHKLNQSELKTAEIEATIREQVGQEASVHLMEMEQHFKERLSNEAKIMESRINSKISLHNRLKGIQDNINQEEKNKEWQLVITSLNQEKQELSRKLDAAIIEVEQRKKVNEDNFNQILTLKAAKRELEEEKNNMISELKSFQEKGSLLQVQHDMEIQEKKAFIEFELQEYKERIALENTTLQLQLNQERREKQALIEELSKWRQKAEESSLLNQSFSDQLKEKHAKSPFKNFNLNTPLRTRIYGAKVALLNESLESKTLFKGDIEKSVSGQGFSVRFTDSEVIPPTPTSASKSQSVLQSPARGGANGVSSGGSGTPTSCQMSTASQWTPDRTADHSIDGSLLMQAIDEDDIDMEMSQMQMDEWQDIDISESDKPAPKRTNSTSSTKKFLIKTKDILTSSSKDVSSLTPKDKEKEKAKSDKELQKEREKMEKEREKERERVEKERLEKEKAEKAENERLEKERAEKEKEAKAKEKKEDKKTAKASSKTTAVKEKEVSTPVEKKKVGALSRVLPFKKSNTTTTVTSTVPAKKGTAATVAKITKSAAATTTVSNATTNRANVNSVAAAVVSPSSHLHPLSPIKSMSSPQLATSSPPASPVSKKMTSSASNSSSDLVTGTNRGPAAKRKLAPKSQMNLLSSSDEEESPQKPTAIQRQKSLRNLTSSSSSSTSSIPLSSFKTPAKTPAITPLKSKFTKVSKLTSQFESAAPQVAPQTPLVVKQHGLRRRSKLKSVIKFELS